MTGKNLFLRSLLLMAVFVLLPSFCRGESAKVDSAQPTHLVCQEKTAAVYKTIPELVYGCGETDDESLTSPERRVNIERYMRELETLFSDPGWWAAPVHALNICGVTEQARAMSDEEERNFELGVNIRLYGGGATRLVVVADPCVRYSYLTLNAFILQRADNRVYASQVLDAYFTRFDGPLEMESADLNGETLILVKTTTMDGTFPPLPNETYSAFTIDLKTHRAVPKKLFMVDGKLTNSFSYDVYMLDDEALEKQWHEPEIVRQGKLAPRFFVYTLAKDHFDRRTYVWKGGYYSPQIKGKK